MEILYMTTCASCWQLWDGWDFVLKEGVWEKVDFVLSLSAPHVAHDCKLAEIFAAAYLLRGLCLFGKPKESFRTPLMHARSFHFCHLVMKAARIPSSWRHNTRLSGSRLRMRSTVSKKKFTQDRHYTWNCAHPISWFKDFPPYDTKAKFKCKCSTKLWMNTIESG